MAQGMEDKIRQISDMLNSPEAGRYPPVIQLTEQGP